MKQIMQDKYILGQSIDKQISVVGEEIRLDLKLAPNTNDLKGGKVNGKVSDINGNGIENALVKLMSTDYEPLMHTVTDNNGNYSFTNVATGSYNIFSISKGTKLKQGNQFSVTELQNITLNFTLEEDPSMKLSIIAGDLTNSTTNDPVGGAVVSLFLKGADNNESLEAVTYTNQYGQYVFREVPKGEYSVKISALGYNSVEASASVSTDGQIVAMNVSITPNSNTSKGTVSGIITNNQNQPVNRADVILYRVNQNSSLTPVAFTKTNANGVYLFANVDQGTYKVKSNQIELVNIEVPNYWIYSPKFISFELIYTQNEHIREYKALNGTLENGAQILPNGYVYKLGGSNHGSATITVKVLEEGKYCVGVEYVNSNNIIGDIKISANGGQRMKHIFAKTIDNTAENSDIYYFNVELNKGDNTIKLYNDEDVTTQSPIINKLFIDKVLIDKYYEANNNNVNLLGSATLKDGLITNISKGLGYITLTYFDIPFDGVYYLLMKYVTTNSDRSSNIDVNNASTDATYTFESTESTNIADAKIKRIPVTLTKGKNTIKIHKA